MSHGKYDFTIKFFRPPQRTVSCHNGLLNTRTKHIRAKDRLDVAEQRILDIERRKSASNIQLLAFEQRQIAKKLASRFRSEQTLQTRRCSISDASEHRTPSWYDTLKMTSYENVHNSKSNLLPLPKSDDFHRIFPSSSDEDISENPILTSENESGYEEEQDENFKPIKKKTIRLPTVAVIPPEEEEVLFPVR